MLRMLKGWLTKTPELAEAAREGAASKPGIQLRFDMPAKTIEWKQFQDLGLITSDAGEWIMPIIKNLHTQGAGYMVMVREIRNQGEPLSKEEKKLFGARANFKLGRRFVDSLTEKGRLNPGKAADEIVYTNYMKPFTSSNADELRQNSDIKYLYLMVDELNQARTCKDARALSLKGRIPRVEAPPLPLNNCTKHCACWYFVDDECFED